MKKIYHACIVFLFAAFTLGAAVFQEIRLFALNPVNAGKSETIIVIEPDRSFKSFVSDFHKAGLVKSPLKFRILARIKGLDKHIKAGEYVFSAQSTPLEILQKLVAGDVMLHRLTIPEGFSLAQIAAAAANSGWGSRERFVLLAKDKAFVKSLGLETKNLEGYLFPDTYFFPRKTTVEQIIITMVRRFNSVFSSNWQKRAQDMGLSMHQIVTLASLIEKETADPSERTLVSSVFHNRIKKGMRLETDPSVIYGLERFNGNLTRKDLQTAGPYNTYLNFGLPPGPIANPGLKSLEAALYPASTDFLYFVSKNNGTHQFSVNLEDHNLAVKKYQSPKPRPRIKSPPKARKKKAR